VAQDMDVCMGCGMLLPSQDPRPADVPRATCPRCGAVGRQKSVGCTITAAASLTANAQLIIGWQEVDRLFAKAEYAAALLVAAVDVEFVLWEHLRCLHPSSPPLKKTQYHEWRAWRCVEKPDRDSVGLGSLVQLAQFFVDSKQLAFDPPLGSSGWALNKARKGIAHDRGYFASLTQLKDPDWPEARIRQVLESTREFCHGNAP